MIQPELHRICRDLGGRPHDWGARAITAKYAGENVSELSGRKPSIANGDEGMVEEEGKNFGTKTEGKEKNNKRSTGPACQSLVVTLPSDWR